MQVQADVIIERPVSLTVNGEVWLTFRCTPVDLEEMGIGFLFNEGIINSMEEVASARVCPSGDNLDVWLHHAAEKPLRWERTSGCSGGMTGLDYNQVERPVLNGQTVRPEQINQMIVELFDRQDLYRLTGGVHTSALSDGTRLHVVAEDIGRHNTLDKIAGHCLMEGIQLQQRILLTTGRISSEMLQKSARLGAAVVVSRTSPSSLSIEMAERLGITLIGYARRNRFNIYSYPERIASPKDQSFQVDPLTNPHVDKG